MKIIYTRQALTSLQAILDFISISHTSDRVLEIRDELLDMADRLVQHPNLGQYEALLEELNLGHRRLVMRNYKIIFRISGDKIFITDIFDTRQNPEKLRQRTPATPNKQEN